MGHTSHCSMPVEYQALIWYSSWTSGPEGDMEGHNFLARRG